MTSEALDDRKKRKRGCLLKIIGLWIAIWAIAITTILTVKGKAKTDPSEVQARVDQLMEIQVPEGFVPYRVNQVLGVEAIAFWDQSHAVDGRATAVIAIQRENGWRDWSVDELRGKTIDTLEVELDKREFRTRSSQTETRMVDGSEVFVHWFSGIQKMDSGLKEATCCYRFIESPEGPLRIQTIGLDSAFPAEQQIALLASIKEITSLN